MKRCPTCDKTFEDSMRFCQVDGTSLVDDAPAFDPYATIVSSPGSMAPFEPEASVDEPASEPAYEAVEASAPFDEALVEPSAPLSPIAEPDDLLEVPAADPLKTMYVSESEMQQVLGGPDAAPEPELEVPAEPDFSPAPAEEAAGPQSPMPEPPSFIEPEMPAPSYGDPAPPPSPFSAMEPMTPSEPLPEPPALEEAETVIQPIEPISYEPTPPAPVSYDPQPAPAAFDPPPPAPVAEWSPPPAPDASWQNQEIGSNTPFSPPPSGVGGQSQGLAIGSLVCGVLSLLCCNWFVVGLTAIILGFVARGKAKSDPANYGGAGLALGGMICGGISLLLGVVIWILYFLGALASFINR